MNKSNHPLNKLRRLIKKNGIKCLLPQNLTDELLHRMVREADAIDDGTTGETPSSTLLMAILHLKSRSIIKGDMEIKMAPEELMESFGLYITSVKIEEKRRKKEIQVAEDSLPTIENIFDNKNHGYCGNVLKSEHVHLILSYA